MAKTQFRSFNRKQKIGIASATVGVFLILSALIYWQQLVAGRLSLQAASEYLGDGINVCNPLYLFGKEKCQALTAKNRLILNAGVFFAGLTMALSGIWVAFRHRKRTPS